MAKLPIQRERERLLAAMPEELQEVAIMLEDGEGKTAKGILKLLRKAGAVIAEVVENTAVYGSNAVEQLAAYRGCNANRIYFMRNFAAVYSEEQVVELFGSVMPNGQSWTVSHVGSLVKIESAKKREAAYKFCRNNGLTSNEFEAHVAATSKVLHPRSGGRKPARIASLPAGMQQVVKKTQEIGNRWEVWNEDVLDRLENATPEEYSPTLYQDAATVLLSLQDMQVEAKKFEERVKKSLQRYDKINGKADSEPVKAKSSKTKATAQLRPAKKKSKAKKKKAKKKVAKKAAKA